jgi:hypothetical protein
VAAEVAVGAAGVGAAAGAMAGGWNPADGVEVARRAEGRAREQTMQAQQAAAVEEAALNLALSHAGGHEPAAEGVLLQGGQQVGFRPPTPVVGSIAGSDEQHTHPSTPSGLGITEGARSATAECNSRSRNLLLRPLRRPAARAPERLRPVAAGVLTHQSDIEFTRELYASRNRVRDLEALVTELRDQAEEREEAVRREVEAEAEQKEAEARRLRDAQAEAEAALAREAEEEAKKEAAVAEKRKERGDRRSQRAAAAERRAAEAAASIKADREAGERARQEAEEAERREEEERVAARDAEAKERREAEYARRLRQKERDDEHKLRSMNPREHTRREEEAQEKVMTVERKRQRVEERLLREGRRDDLRVEEAGLTEALRRATALCGRGVGPAARTDAEAPARKAATEEEKKADAAAELAAAAKARAATATAAAAFASTGADAAREKASHFRQFAALVAAPALEAATAAAEKAAEAKEALGNATAAKVAAKMDKRTDKKAMAAATRKEKAAMRNEKLYAAAAKEAAEKVEKVRRGAETQAKKEAEAAEAAAAKAEAEALDKVQAARGEQARLDQASEAATRTAGDAALRAAAEQEAAEEETSANAALRGRVRDALGKVRASSAKPDVFLFEGVYLGAFEELRDDIWTLLCETEEELARLEGEEAAWRATDLAVAWLLDEGEAVAATHYVEQAARAEEAVQQTALRVAEQLMAAGIGEAAQDFFVKETAAMTLEAVCEILMGEGETEMDLFLEDCKEGRLREDYAATRRQATEQKLARRAHAIAWDASKQAELDELEERKRQEAMACRRKAAAEKVSRRALAAGAPAPSTAAHHQHAHAHAARALIVYARCAQVRCAHSRRTTLPWARRSLGWRGWRRRGSGSRRPW